MENLFGWIIILVIASVIGHRGGKILREKGRPYYLGFALAFCFSLVGLLVCYAIPATAEARAQSAQMQR